MTVYAIAQLKFTDRDAYNRYQAAFMKVFQRYSGTLLAADETPKVVEGKWDREKVVLMAFPDEAAFREWADHLITSGFQKIAARVLTRWWCWCKGCRPLSSSELRYAGTTTVSSLPRRSTRMSARRATAATCAASSGSDRVVASARARRPLCALLK